jgi:hypothetical protein
MAMTFELLNRIFQDIESTYTLKNAREKAILFYKCARSINAEMQGDWWIQVSREWDVNFWKNEEHYFMSIYRISYKEGQGMVTDTSAPVDGQLLDNFMLS